MEIRPAGEAAPSAEGEGSSEEKASQEGENAPENNKPQIEPIEFVGVLELVSDGGYGFVRRENYLPSPQDVFVPTNLIRRFGLRIGDQIRGFALPKRGQEKNLALSYITTVNDVEIDKLGRRPHFEKEHADRKKKDRQTVKCGSRPLRDLHAARKVIRFCAG